MNCSIMLEGNGAQDPGAVPGRSTKSALVVPQRPLQISEQRASEGPEIVSIGLQVLTGSTRKAKTVNLAKSTNANDEVFALAA